MSDIMRNLSRHYRLQGFSFPEVTSEFERLCLGMADSLSYQGRKLKPGHVLNALAIVWGGMPAAEREKMVRVGLTRLVELAEKEEGPGDLKPPGPTVVPVRVKGVRGKAASPKRKDGGK